MLAGRLRTASRRANAVGSTRYIHRFQTGGLLQADGSIRATQRRLWLGGNAFHNAVAVRNASFARFLPKLVLKFVRIPAMFGGLAIGAFAWVQYQANRMSLFATNFYARYPNLKQRPALMPSIFSIRPKTQLRTQLRIFLAAPRESLSKHFKAGRIRRTRLSFLNG